MRKKEPVRGDTPLRRSTRLQQERTGEQLQILKESQGSKERSIADILQPRESIRAHRQVVHTKESLPPPPPPSDPLPVSAPETPKDSRQAVSERDNLVPQDPNVEWEVVKDQRARLRVLETRPQSAELRAMVEQEAPSLQGMVVNRTLRQQARAGITPRSWDPASKVRGRTEADPRKLQSTALPSKAAGKKWTKRLFSLPTLFFLLFLLILGFTGWFIWKHGSPVSFSGLATYGQWALSSFPRLWSRTEECSTQCSLVLVESIPDSLVYQPEDVRHLSIYQAWMDLLAEANSSVDIAAFYFTLRDSDIKMEHPSSQQGRDVFNSLLGLPSRGIKLSIAVNSPQMSEDDTDELARQGADIEYVNMKNLTGGIVHTKFWVVDQKHVYIGSANMDWRSLTQVKELGAVLYNCSCLARDLGRIFAMYRMLGGEGASIPAAWPASVAAESSLNHPLQLQLNGSSAELYISSSPSALCSAGRTSDLTAIVRTIEDAQDFVYISVMDYEPQCFFCKPKRFWPVIDDALRAAACDRKVNVRLLISCWPHSHRDMFVFLESLSILSQEPLGCPIEVNLFVVPGEGEQPPIPYAHVNHNKYMVTDRLAYIGTSNWSEDYFTKTAGVGLIVNQSDPNSIMAGQEFTLRHQLEQVFIRDWNSDNVLPLSNHRSCTKRY
ncbi:5'-3' exonuclease PLD3-like isoform X2 [Eublepharis macularius]|uniref:5'-3' exonuclease PLD3-like isoform X2 n=1 Tax=Eublepharis macularius TaxID=481883 RepID=A0AA97JZP4_EUBMA|nr:5'-3' exonuclease PLD3-like isoform X2 [Eublepharis macularius]